MDTTDVSTVVALIVALSIAAERAVEIVKGIVPALATQNPEPNKERLRKLALHVLAMGFGILTAFLAQPAIQTVTPRLFESVTSVIALGLLASGGSGFWNSVSTYVEKVKEIAKIQAVDTKAKRLRDPEVAEPNEVQARLRSIS